MYKIVIWFSIFHISIFFSASAICRDLPKPELMLANTYHEGTNLSEYWVSEKLDGVRAYWDGKQLISRGGNIYHAPTWFISGFPKEKLDGELWIGRQQFEDVVSTVRDKTPNHKAWKNIKFMVFDLPDRKMLFDERFKQLQLIVKRTKIPWLKVVKQWRVKNHTALLKQLDNYVSSGAEGLMLHRGSSFYQAKRNGDLLKVKRHQDAEAIVVKHIEGKGKLKGILGALIVKTPEGLHFKIGTGFSMKERRAPPSLGATVTYRYRGKTKNGIPRFASFLRIREVEE